MSVYSFEVRPESIARAFSVYVVVAVRQRPEFLYVGKTGDNRAGCNPIISRCGNHFSYFRVHSQIRNKIADHEKYSYRYFFVHFDRYREDRSNRNAIDRINEMERWLNQKIQTVLDGTDIEHLNPYKGRNPSAKTRAAARTFRKPENERKVDELVAEAVSFVQSFNSN